MISIQLFKITSEAYLYGILVCKLQVWVRCRKEDAESHIEASEDITSHDFLHLSFKSAGANIFVWGS
jgi:hypothetical protein